MIGAPSQAVTLAITLLRTGAAVLIEQPGRKDSAVAVAAIETLNEASFMAFCAAATSPVEVVMTLPRAEAMGLRTAGEVCSVRQAMAKL